jgi:predicted TIM-barrel fold metal-dependent hydrolase
MIISSDGHAAPRMRTYRPYLKSSLHDEFDAFCDHFDELALGMSSQSKALKLSIDEDVADWWDHNYVHNHRIDGLWDADRRLEVLAEEGICGEVLIPDFGTPFIFGAPSVLRQMRLPRPTAEQLRAGDEAFNRWLADFVSAAPERFAGQAKIHFDDVDWAIAQIKLAKELGLKGVMIPAFDSEAPLFSPRFDPIWSTLEDLDLPVTSHVSISMTSDFMYNLSEVPHPGCAGPLGRSTALTFCHHILDHLVWGGVLERHPRLRVVFTEQGTGWLPSKLRQMDYTYAGSYMRQDLKSVIKCPPSEYFERQCWIGSSLLARAEIEHRHSIGVDKMMVGVDYPHFEGTWNGGNFDYLQAAFGGLGVTEPEARMMLGETIAGVYGFDAEALQGVADEIGPEPERILVAPTENLFPRGDVHKPFGSSVL